MLPTFIVVGAMKGGTTSLAEYLGAHPDVFMATPKELDFFSNHWERGTNWYEQHFPVPALARGEASPRYSRAPKYGDVSKRMASLVPDVRLIFLLRDPVERIRSSYSHWVSEGHETRPIEVAVRDRPEYLDASRYAYQIELYLEYFDRDQLLILASDDLRDRREETMAVVLAFIGVDPGKPIDNLHEEFNVTAKRTRQFVPARRLRDGLERLHVRQLVPASWRATAHRTIVERRAPEPDTALTPEFEAELWAQLEPDLRRLRSIVGPDFDLWGHA